MQDLSLLPETVIRLVTVAVVMNMAAVSTSIKYRFSLETVLPPFKTDFLFRLYIPDDSI